MQNAPIGKRFSQVYLDRGKPTNDSSRFRRRLAQQCHDMVGNWQNRVDFGKFMIAEAGIPVRVSGGVHQVEEVFSAGELHDVLDAITLLYRFLKKIKGTEEQWRVFVARAMQEENVGYQLDRQCGVHFFVDQEFEQNRAATLAVLDHPSLANARAAFDDAFRHLDSQPRDTKAAVRSIFETAEILAKQICPDAKNLNKWLAENTLKQKCLETIKGDAVERRVFEGMFDSLATWANALHNYRHGQAEDAPVAPSEELTVYAISTGSAHVRLLAQCFLRLPATGG